VRDGTQAGGRGEQQYASILAAQATTGEESTIRPFSANLSLIVSQTTEAANSGKFVGSVGSLNMAARMAVQNGDGQGKVWEEVAKENAKGGVKAESGTFAGNYAEEEAIQRLKPFLRQLHKPIDETQNVVGVIVAVNGETASLDVGPLREALNGRFISLARSDLSNEDRLHFDFAVGKALEDRREFAESFEHYERGNRLRRKHAQYRADDTTANVQRAIEFYSRSFLEARQGQGAPAADPIFIVGLPRSGSTLLEQILSSHSQVEGTMELPDILTIARKLGGRKSRDEEPLYPQALADLDASDLRAFGEQYLAQTSIQRKEQKPYFVDKMPNNWLHVGLIHLILPNAKIIDARRHPLSCCFSNFKQHFARGQHFTYDLEEVGRFYRDYVRLMDHFDEVLPGRIHRVYYERMVADTESEVRRVLAYCGLPFEDACLRFYESERAVRTAGSEQVRSPIYRDAVDRLLRQLFGRRIRGGAEKLRCQRRELVLHQGIDVRIDLTNFVGAINTGRGHTVAIVFSNTGKVVSFVNREDEQRVAFCNPVSCQPVEELHMGLDCDP
jgi:hypothetical protein